MMEKRLVNITKVGLVTAAIFFHKKQTESDTFYIISSSKLSHRGFIKSHSILYNIYSSSSKSYAFFRNAISKIFSNINETFFDFTTGFISARPITKANNYITNLTIKMPMTEPITTTPMTRYCSRAPWSYKLCLTKTQLYL